jgi:tetratricopeptide (TPR) repeat protein
LDGERWALSSWFLRQVGKIVLFCLLVAVCPHEGIAAAANPFEPTVTQKEATLLSTVVKQAEDDPSMAIAMLRERITEKTSPALDFALGNFYYQGRKLDAAETAYRAAIAKLPRFRGALNNLARVYLMQDKPKAAMEMFQSLVSDGQGDADALLLLGHCLLMLEKPVQAEGAYRQSLVLAPDHSNAMRGLIKCLIEQQRNPEVLALTRELQKIFPLDVELWNLRANAHLALNQYTQAIQSLESARALDASSPGMLATLGDLYLNREQPREAVAAYEAAFALESPGAARLLQAAQGFLAIEALGEAEAMLKKMDALPENETTDRQHLPRRQRLEACLAVLQGKLDDAMDKYAQVIRMDPLDGESLLALADLRMASDNAGTARMLYERAARIDGYEAQALVRQAQLEVDQNRFREAVSLLERAQVFESQAHVARYLEQVRRLIR